MSPRDLEYALTKMKPLIVQKQVEDTLNNSRNLEKQAESTLNKSRDLERALRKLEVDNFVSTLNRAELEHTLSKSRTLLLTAPEPSPGPYFAPSPAPAPPLTASEPSPGLYRIVRDKTCVTRGMLLDSGDVAELGKDDVVEVAEVQSLSHAETRVRGRVLEPAGWISLEKVDCKQRWAAPEPRREQPGRYTMVHDCAEVTKGCALQSKRVGSLPKGTEVDVLEVRVSTCEQRIRGRIADPAGWISLVKTRSGDRWATLRA